MSNIVKVLRTGYSFKTSDGLIHADCTITLITGDKNVLVDTGGYWAASQLIEELTESGLSPNDINTVVCTHGHSDHIGCLSLFQNSDMIVGFDVFTKDAYTLHNFRSGLELKIAEGITVKPTPGHTGEDVSVLVETEDGLIAIVGDLFENEADIEDKSIWLEHSANPEVQRFHRDNILKIASAIIPGHGRLFSAQRKENSSLPSNKIR